MTMLRRFRRGYGAGPLHLLAMIASLLIAGAAVAGWLHNDGSTVKLILIWFVGSIVGHDLVLLPLYSALDRIASGTVSARPSNPAPLERTPAWVYVRVPALLCGLLALVFFPEILRLGNQTFHTASGMTQDVYLARFLLTCGALFLISGVAYAVNAGRARRSTRTAAPLRPDTPDR